MNSKAFSRVFLPKSEKYFQNLKYFPCPGLEPTPVDYRSCILPLSQAAIIFVGFKLTILLPQQTVSRHGAFDTVVSQRKCDCCTLVSPDWQLKEGISSQGKLSTYIYEQWEPDFKQAAAPETPAFVYGLDALCRPFQSIRWLQQPTIELWEVELLERLC